MEQISRYIRQMICFPIKLYQWLISPMFPANCRFYPSCSHYALDALAHHGLGRGIWLTCRRLLRCHPWADGGYDPVLPNQEKKI